MTESLNPSAFATIKIGNLSTEALLLIVNWNELQILVNFFRSCLFYVVHIIKVALVGVFL